MNFVNFHASIHQPSQFLIQGVIPATLILYLPYLPGPLYVKLSDPSDNNLEPMPFISEKIQYQLHMGVCLCWKVWQWFRNASCDFLHLFCNFVRNGMEKIRGLICKLLTVHPSIWSLQATLIFPQCCAISKLQSKTPLRPLFCQVSLSTERKL